MVTKSSPLTGTNLEEETNERYEEDLLEESKKTESGLLTKEKSKVVPLFPRSRTELTDSRGFEVDVTAHEGIRPATNVSGRSHPDSKRAPVSPKDSVSSEPSFEFLETMKMHFLRPLLDAFDKIQLHANSADAAFYVDTILHTIRHMEDHSPRDPFLDILFALYDALAINNNWTKYGAEQYREAKKVLEKYSGRSGLGQKAIEKAIEELEEIGFDTTPFVLDMDIAKE